jgi:hypothetical protein
MLAARCLDKDTTLADAARAVVASVGRRRGR